ncbi:MAG: 2-phospho-L-lactate guanylyltransferase [Anaerolineae bacterium]|jgi:2-phospho-L-lactate guanylyltransferase|nr:2-phospho-L-lactate guanylyltransferase [Anaerolineae bacterium]
MTVWAIVPVKPLRRGKSRLAEVLSQDERTDLNRRLLSHTLDTLAELPEIEHVLVVSRDQGVLALAREHGARTVQENGAPQLNASLTRATILARTYATRGVLIIPADLPLIAPEDVRAILEKAVDPPVVVVAPDRRREGTNVLLVCPAGIIEYEFGPGSFQRHCERALQAGARLEVCELPSLALDMDLPEDLKLVSETIEGFQQIEY